MAKNSKNTQHPHHLKSRLAEVRNLILTLAKMTNDVGEIEESLKWGQKSFVPKPKNGRPKSGTPIRIDGDEATNTYSLYVPCSTHIISDFREIHPDIFAYHGNREIRLSLDAPLPKVELGLFITAALTYYLPS